MDTFIHILSRAFTLFLLMDSIGNIPLFLSFLKGLPSKLQSKIIVREMLIALGIIVFFYFLGDFFLDILNIKQETTFIAGGLILFLIAIHMVFMPSSEKDTNTPRDIAPQNPFIVPLAIPFIAGPAVLAAVMIQSEQETSFISLCAIALAWIVSVGVLLMASKLRTLLGSKGLLACEKLMGLLLTLIAIQMILQGFEMYTVNLHKLLSS